MAQASGEVTGPAPSPYTDRLTVSSEDRSSEAMRAP
jgi:hypothetical protein